MTVTIEPEVKVNAVENIAPPSYGIAGKIATIGAFPTATFKLGVFTTAKAAKEAMVEGTDYKLPDDNTAEHASKTVVPTTYKAFYALDELFISNSQSEGPEYVLIVNTNYGKGTLVQTSSNADIAAACVLLSDEKFDILNIAEPISVAVEGDNNTYVLNPICTTLKSFADSQFNADKPFGIDTGFDLTNVTTTILTAFKNLFNTLEGGMYKAVSTPIKKNGASESLTIEQSGAWHAAYTAGRAVNMTETAKVYPEIIGEDTRDLYPKTGTVTYLKLIEAGFHTTKYRDRIQKTIQCINNITPCGYPMKVERIRNYMIKRLTLEDYLGDDNTKVTFGRIIGLIESEKKEAIKAGYIKDMEYTIKAVTTEKVKIDAKLIIYDEIRLIELNVAVEISAQLDGE